MATEQNPPMVPWWRNAVVYQIWPRSFADSNGDGVGDLGGIIEHLDYLNDGQGGGLGVDALWISPFFVSPLADFGYDVADYTAVDPEFGTMGQFDELVEAAHRRGLKLLLDWVPNHTSDQHPWFIESRSSRGNAKRNWYRWRDGSFDGGPPNNWMSAFGAVGPAWTFDERTGQYYHHSYSASQPDLNWDNPDVREAMYAGLRFWLDRGVDGFRIDVAHRLGKDPLYRDNEPPTQDSEPREPGRRDADWPTTLDYLREVRLVADEYSDRLLVGEVYVLNQHRIIEYLNAGDGLHLAHNFVFMAQPWSSRAFADTINDFEAVCGPSLDPAWCLNNHDHSRVRSRFDEDGCGESRARSAAVLLLGLRGTVFVYQGEELGLPDSDMAAEGRHDLDGRDPVRTPIPWAPPSIAGPGAGFTTATPWLPVGSTSESLNVDGLTGQSDSILELYKRLIGIRKTSAALSVGAYAPLYVDDRMFIYERRHRDEAVLVAINYSTERCALPSGLLTEDAALLISSLDEAEAEHPLLPLEARWIRCRSESAHVSSLTRE